MAETLKLGELEKYGMLEQHIKHGHGMNQNNQNDSAMVFAAASRLTEAVDSLYDHMQESGSAHPEAGLDRLHYQRALEYAKVGPVMRDTIVELLGFVNVEVKAYEQLKNDPSHYSSTERNWYETMSVVAFKAESLVAMMDNPLESGARGAH